MNDFGFAFASLFTVSLSLSCVGEVGTQGPTGPQGLQGPEGPPGSSASSFNVCPIGYNRDSTETQFTVCKRGQDTVVKVGRFASAFWIDRYEASMWEKEDGSGKQYGGTGGDDYPSGFRKNGQLTTTVFALSIANVTPSRFLTWFQANEACAASGKRLPTNAEWQRAARGTVDPGSSDGTGGNCVTNAAGPRNTGLGSKCVSDWGAQDMIGNAYEIVSEWVMGPGSNGQETQPWQTMPGTQDPLYNSDLVANISSGSITGSGGYIVGAPSMLMRGGNFSVIDTGVKAGLFSMNLNLGPSFSNYTTGVRCVTTQ